MPAIDGAHLRVIRERDGSSQVSLAERLGISPQYLADIEAGRRTLKRNPALIKKIANVLDIPVSMIIRRSVEDAA